MNARASYVNALHIVADLVNSRALVAGGRRGYSGSSHVTFRIRVESKMPSNSSRGRFYVGRSFRVLPIVWDRIKTCPNKFDWRFDPRKPADFINHEERATLTTSNDSWESSREM